MNEYYFTFQSLTAAQNASKMLKYFGISAPVISTPAALSPEGCGYSLGINKEEYNIVRQLFQQKMVPSRQILTGKNSKTGEGSR